MFIYGCVCVYLMSYKFKYVNLNTQDTLWCMEALVCKLYEMPRDNDLGSNVVLRAGRHDHKVTPSYPTTATVLKQSSPSLLHSYP